MITTEIKIVCDKCHKQIPKCLKHSIIWHDGTADAEFEDPMVADLCEDCYDEVIKQGLGRYSYPNE